MIRLDSYVLQYTRICATVNSEYMNGNFNLIIVLMMLWQMVVSVAAGPWDALFGGGNLPAFVVGAVAAAASGILAFTMLPSPPPDIPSNKRAATSTAAFH